jgi:hypothetical protein
VSQYAITNNLAHGLGCVKDKPEDDFKEMVFSLDFFVTFFIKEKSMKENTLLFKTLVLLFLFAWLKRN